MEVIAFVGPSGTGKSHHAIGVAFDNKCDAIIDDGLLIKGTKILAGTSAKNEQNRIQAVKRAIFTDKEHAAEVRKALATSGIKRLLIIATSDNMIGKITKKLELDPPVKTVYINEVASKAAVNMAAERMAAADTVRIIPAVAAGPTLYWREKMQAKHAGYITEVHLMMVPSLILPMTGANRWNSYAAPA